MTDAAIKHPPATTFSFKLQRGDALRRQNVHRTIVTYDDNGAETDRTTDIVGMVVKVRHQSPRTHATGTRWYAWRPDGEPVTIHGGDPRAFETRWLAAKCLGNDVDIRRRNDELTG